MIESDSRAHSNGVLVFYFRCGFVENIKTLVKFLENGISYCFFLFLWLRLPFFEQFSRDSQMF